MASSIVLYGITITNGNAANLAPADGFVDYRGIDGYGVPFDTTGTLSYDLAKAKQRGNLRYRAIIDQLQMVSNVYIDPNTIVTDATAITQGTDFSFQIWVEHGAASMLTHDETNLGAVLVGTDCVTRCVARALTAPMITNVNVFDPTSSVSTGVFGDTASVPRYGERSNTGFMVDPYADDLEAAEGMIDVVEIVI